MFGVWVYALISVLIVSLISFVGLIALTTKTKWLKTTLLYLVSFSAGALFGGAFFHLLPKIIENSGFSFLMSSLIISGIILFFIIEKIVKWQHCHHPIEHDKHVHSFAIMNLIGDGVHNFLDGLIIGASYLVSIPTGIASTVAVSLHEIPQEIGDFGVLIYGGFSKRKALMLNFASAMTAVVGAVIALILNQYIENIEFFLIPLAVGGFIYIAGSDLIPELHKEFTTRKSLLQLVTFLAGVLIMIALLFVE